MFTGLKPAAAVEGAIPPAPVETTFELPENVFDSVLEALPDVSPARVLQMQTRDTEKELSAFIVSVETFGLSRALLSFANFDGKLRAAVPEIPALEAMAADLTAEESAAILTALKAIDLKKKAEDEDPEEDPDEGDEPGEEVLLIAGMAIYGIVSMILSVVTFVATIKGFRHWNTTKDDEEGRLAKVLPFGTIAEYLHTAMEGARICKEVEDLDLPKTEEEYTAFTKRVDAIAAPLAKFGVHVSGDDIKTEAFPKAVKGSIEKIGYGEGSLSEIADMLIKMKDVTNELKSITMKKHDVQWKAMAKAERRYGGDGCDLAGDVIHSTVMRMGKVVKLAKSTCGSIKKFYKE